MTGITSGMRSEPEGPKEGRHLPPLPASPPSQLAQIIRDSLSLPKSPPPGSPPGSPLNRGKVTTTGAGNGTSVSKLAQRTLPSPPVRPHSPPTPTSTTSPLQRPQSTPPLSNRPLPPTRHLEIGSPPLHGIPSPNLPPPPAPRLKPQQASEKLNPSKTPKFDLKPPTSSTEKSG